MKYLSIILTIAISAFLGYLLMNSIKEPIAFKAEKDKRESAVQGKLMDIRNAQQVYRKIKGKYANNFDSLAHTLKTGKIEFVKLEEDPKFPGDPDKFIKTSTFSPAIDSIRALGIKDLDKLRYVPYTDGKTFSIKADTTTYQSAVVNVVEVGTTYKEFMGEFADDKYKKYDERYDVNKPVKFGDMNKPSTSGNW